VQLLFGCVEAAPVTDGFPVGETLTPLEIGVQAVQRRVGYAARCLEFQVLFRVAPHRTGRAPLKASGSPVTTP
jgi:hypothetical protein